MPSLAEDIAAARRFTRFYVRYAEVLDEAFLGSRFSAGEGRVIYELGARGESEAAALGQVLGLDRGYLSRMLGRFEEAGFLDRTPSAVDGRRQRLALTADGRAAFAELDRTSQRQWENRLAGLDPSERERLVEAMGSVEALLAPTSRAAAPIRLRDHEVGDTGWVAHRQGLLYAAEYGWDATFEALVAEILAAFARTRDPARERGWIAEREGVVLGSVYCVRESDEVAKLRLLYVEPAARGTGLGARLVGECIAYARSRGYGRLVLWTNDCLDAARRIYQRAGFTLVEEERHHAFGANLVGQNWALNLQAA